MSLTLHGPGYSVYVRIVRLVLAENALEPVPEKCGRFSDQDRLRIKGLEHFR